MKKWKVLVANKAQKQLKKLDGSILALADKAISRLEIDGPIPEGWDVKKISKDEYRIRLNYRYRMRYTVEINYLIIDIFYIGHRKDAY